MEGPRQTIGADEMFCMSCGSIIKKQAAICVHCGIGFSRGPVSETSQRKDKTVAVLLAVFLGFWTWLYTYNKDAWKFWVGLGLTLTVFNPLWTWMILGIPNIAIGIWAIVDVAIKPREFYEFD